MSMMKFLDGSANMPVDKSTKSALQIQEQVKRETLEKGPTGICLQGPRFRPMDSLLLHSPVKLRRLLHCRSNAFVCELHVVILLG